MTPRRETEIIEAALTRFRELTGLEVALRLFAPGQNQGADGWIQITQGTEELTLWVECKEHADRVATLHRVMEQLKHLDGPGLLITPYLPPELARKCQELGLLFLDAAGNAYLKHEGLFVLTTGQKPGRTHLQKEQPRRAFDRTGLRVVFALLTEPALLQATYRDIAKAAGVALGTVGRVLTDLRERQLLVEDREGIRRWIDREKAIQTWTTNYPFRLRERLQIRRFRAKDDDWWKAAKPEDFGGYWGGEVAAAKLLGELIPKTATLYLPEDRNAFLAAHRLRADPEGPIEVLDTFWNFPLNETLPAGIAPPLLVCADLLNIGDPRTLEQARMIHDHYLA